MAEKISLKKTMDDLVKKYGTGSVGIYGDMDKIDVKRISSGLPSLDHILWWGIPEWRILEIHWPQSSGKTTLAIKFLAEVQNAYPDKKVAFIDVEHALDPDYAEVLGLNMKDLIFSQPDGAEQALEIMEALANSGEVKAIILDSVAQLTPAKELEWEMGAPEMGGRARLLSQALRKITPAASKNECTIFFINQVRQNIWGYGAPEVTPGGNAIPFASSITLRIGSKKVDETHSDSTIKVQKNKVGKPFGETTIPIYFGTGFDIVHDTLTLAVELGIISRGGSWFTYGEEKWQGIDGVREKAKADPKFVNEIRAKIKIELNK